MSDGTFSARARLAANIATLIYTAPDDATVAAVTANINVVNAGTARVKVSVAITAGAAPADGDWIESNMPLDPNGPPLLRTNEPLAPGEAVYVKSDAANCDVRVSGYSEAV